MLKGSEVKSLRKARCSGTYYAVFFQRELWLVGLNISAYSHSGTAFAHDNDRRRKRWPPTPTPAGRWSTERVLRLFRSPSTSRTDEPRSRWALPVARSSTIVAKTPSATPASTPERRCLAPTAPIASLSTLAAVRPVG